MQWTVQVTVLLLSTVWIIFFLKTDPHSVFVQRRSSDEEVQSDTSSTTAEECRTPADIAFLLDGSSSVSHHDFQRMKKFVKDVITSFKGNNTKFAIVQFSTRSTIHYYFDTFDANNGQTQIDGIRQLTGLTNTATALQRVVQEVFTPTRGSRSDVKVLIVITDGESSDQHDLVNAANLAENNNIVRFVIGVGVAFTKPAAVQELNTIASSPPEDHVFRVENFEVLENIRQNLEDKTQEVCQETPKSTQDTNRRSNLTGAEFEADIIDVAETTPARPPVQRPTSSQVQIGPRTHDGFQCCFEIFTGRVPWRHIKKYYRTSSFCPMEAIVLVTIRHQEICVDPHSEWVQHSVKDIEQGNMSSATNV